MGKSIVSGGTTVTESPLSSKKTRVFSLSIRRRLSDAYGVVAPDARRPSLRTDLLIMKKKTANPAVDSSGPITTFRTSSCAIQ